MKSFSALLPSALLLGAALVHAGPSPREFAQVVERSGYVGGWPLALSASETSGCPSYAPVPAQAEDVSLECCPSGQVAFVNPSDIHYCCPDKNDCHDAVLLFPACANSTWIMYQYFNGGSFFCCEPGQIATESDYGLCEPSDVAVPSAQINKPISQDTVAVAAATSAPPAIVTTSSAVVVVSTDTALSSVTTTSTVASAGNSSAAAVSSSTIVGSASGASATANTVTSGNPAIVSTSTGAGTAAASASASPSAKTGGSGRVGVASGVIGTVVVALCLGVGVEVMLG